jgi:hypothetical protein
MNIPYSDKVNPGTRQGQSAFAATHPEAHTPSLVEAIL